MLALGEDPQEFENLKQELMTASGPGDALWEKQIDDLAKLYWRRQRLERAQEGVMRRALQAVEDWQHRRQQEIAGATFDASQPEILDVSLSESADPDVRLRKTLSYLEVIREQAKQRTFRARQVGVLESLYQARKGWRQAQLLHLLRLFSEAAKLRANQEDEDFEKLLCETFGPTEQAGEPQYQELLRLLDAEIASVREDFQHAEKVNEEKAAIERDACLAPVGETWRMMLRQEAGMDHSIDRKVKILLTLRRESPGYDLPAFPNGQGDDADKETTGHENECETSEAAQPNPHPSGPGEKSPLIVDGGRTRRQLRCRTPREMTERSLNVVENKGPGRKTWERSLNVRENKGS